MSSFQETLRRAWARFCELMGYPPPDEDGERVEAAPGAPGVSDWPPDRSLYAPGERVEPEPPARKPKPLAEILEAEAAPPVEEWGEELAQEPLPFPTERAPAAEETPTAPVRPAFEAEVETRPPAGAAPETPSPPAEFEEPAPPEEAPPPVAPREPAPPDLFRYEVQPDETLSGIAKRFGVTVRALVEANDLPDPNRIYAGQKLTIPGYAPAPAASAPPEEGAPELEALELEEAFRYQVRPGDTLSGVAKRFRVTVRALLEANDLEDPGSLPAGQWLVIPGVSAEPVVTEPLPPLEAEREPPAAGLARGFYLSYRALGHPAFREYVFDLLESTGFNALAIDVKADEGWLAHPTQVTRAINAGADRPSAPDLAEVVDGLKARGIYLAARLVTFKDNLLARANPHFAARIPGGKDLWLDRSNQAWVDPFLEEVWDYNIEIAAEAARLGFDEILFDFLRFPLPSQSGRPQFSQKSTPETRLGAITGFLGAARGRLAPLGVNLAANVFGYACWRHDDALVGHQLERLSPYLDVLCPLLYPSTFGGGIPGCQVAVECPYEIVYESARRAIDRVATNECQVRPWLQDFPDYRFDRRTFSAAEIQAQVQGAVDAGCAGFMMWDPRVKYTPEAY